MARDIVDPGKPAKPTPKPKAKTQGKPSGRGRQPAPPSVEFGYDRLIPGTKSHDPIVNATKATSPAGVAKADANRAEIVRKQQILVARGYNVVVDGVWGPRSQKAWNTYLTRNQAGQTGPQKTEKGQASSVREYWRDVRAKKEQERLAAERATEQRIQERKVVLARAKTFKLDPRAARRATFRQLADVLLDREANMGITSKEGARAYQEWAVEHKVPGVRITGVYDQQTDRAIRAQFTREARKERAQHASYVRKTLYPQAGVKAGDKVDWLPYGRVVPSAEELDKIIQGEDNGWQAHATLNALMMRAVTNGSSFDIWRRAELMKTATTLQPFSAAGALGKVGSPAWLRGQHTGGDQLTYLASILGIQVLAPTADLSRQFGQKHGIPTPGSEADFAEFQQTIYKNDEFALDNKKRLGRLHAEVRALTHSSSPDEFSTRLGLYMAAEDQANATFQKKLAGTTGTWWGDAIDKIMYPGKWMRTAFVYEGMVATQFVSDALGGYKTRDLRWEDAMAVLGDSPKGYAGGFDGQDIKGGGWTKFAYDVLVDPLNVAHPFRATSTGMRFAAGLAGRGGTLGGYRVMQSGLEAAKSGRLIFNKTQAFGVIRAHGQALVYDKGTWSKAAGLGRVDDALTDMFHVQAIHDTAGFQKAAALVSRSAALKVNAAAKARASVARMAKHGFKNPTGPINANGTMPDWAIHEPKSKHTRKLIDHGFNAVESWFTKDAWMADEIASYIAQGQSMYVKADRSIQSNVGASLIANLTVKADVLARHSVATQEATRVYEELVSKIPVVGEDGTADEINHVRALYKEAAHAAQRQYQQIVQGSGTYVKGGYLVHGGEAAKEILLRIEDTVQVRLSQIEDTLIPTIQGMIERDLAAKGDSLWDDAQLWKGRDGESANNVRSLARESFEKEVEQTNPQFGHAWDEGEYTKLVESEVRRSGTRLSKWALRESAAGRLPEGWSLEQGLEAERTKIMGHWEKRHGQYFDTRETVMVSDLYTRAHSQAWTVDAKTGEMLWRGRGEAFDAGDEARQALANLAEAPRFVQGTDTDSALWHLMWNLGGGTKFRNTLAFQHGTDTRWYMGPQAKFGTEDYAEEIAHGKALENAVNMTQEGLGRAWDEAISGELRSETALWQALAHSQNAYAKAIYTGLSASLNIWVFSTLALRPGWMVRNVIDNTAKTILAGVHDPRMLMQGAENPGAATKSLFTAPGQDVSQEVLSVFDVGLVQLRQTIAWLDRLMGTNALHYWLRLEEMVWGLGTPALKAIFHAHNVPVPESVLDEMQLDPFESTDTLRGKPAVDEQNLIDQGLLVDAGGWTKTRQVIGNKWEDFRDGAFELMGNRPENYYKRIIYRHELMNQQKLLRTNAKYVIPAKQYEQPVTEAELAAYTDALHAWDDAHGSWRFETKVRDEDGNIREVFHGSKQVFDQFDPRKNTEDSMLLYSQGYYFTESPRIASDYAGEMQFAATDSRIVGTRAEGMQLADDISVQKGIPRDEIRVFELDSLPDMPHAPQDWAVEFRIPATTPNVRISHLDIRKPLDLDKTFAPQWDGTDFTRLRQSLSTRKQQIIPGTLTRDQAAKRIYDELTKAGDDALKMRQFFSNDTDYAFSSLTRRGHGDWDEEILFDLEGNFMRDVMRDMGYDGWTHMGGRILGGDEHKVWIAFEPEQVKAANQQVGPKPVRPEPTTVNVPESINEAMLDIDAHHLAWAKVRETLFDYSQISVVEDNFRVFFPFIQFWRKNTVWWANQFVNKPWLPLSVVKADDARREAHADLPPWMRRYLTFDGRSDVASRIPGLEPIIQAMLPDDVQYDPMNLMSFAPIYRSIPDIMDFLGEQVGMEAGLSDRLKTKNPSLPGEKEGWAVFGPMIDALSDWGLGLSPFARKPLENVGIANERSWQFMFPQTPLAVAFTREFLGDAAAGHVANWETIFTLMQGDTPSDAIAENFEYYVQQFVAEQVSRGEQPDFEAAKQGVRHWFLMQNVWGYFTGVYWRRATPEDIYLAKLAVADQEDVPDDQQQALALWRMRGHDPLAYRTYVEMMPLIQAYYRSGDWETKQRLKREHPDLIPYVDATWRGKPYSGKWLRNAAKYTQTGKFYQALEILDHLDAPREVKQAALDIFTTPELKAYWKENDTPKQTREAMTKASAFEYFEDLNAEYHAIPGDDWEAKDGFMAEHPELIRYWNRNNDAVDDYEAAIHSANAALRSEYFAIVKAQGFGAAANFLKTFKFMFEDTKSADKIDLKTGTWKGGGGGHGGKWSAERYADYARAKPHMTWFFDTYMKKVGEKAAWGWLQSTDSPIAKIIRDYLAKWGKHSQKSVDYLRAKPWLEVYFALPEAKRSAWLNGDSDGARIVKAYFAKYSSHKGMTQHGKDYLAAKSQLAMYFALPQAKRNAWLNGNSPEAKIVKEYFKKYGHTHRYERAFLNKYPQLSHGTPEQRKRMEFWKGYFALTPDLRAAYVLANAEKSGVFVYGEFGEEERHDREAEYNRRAVGLGLNQRQTDYLYAKPLLDFYFTLPKNERAMFARLNPEVSEYLTKYGKAKLTGNKALDAAIEHYFKLPPDSNARSAWLKANPKVQDYFDSKSSPAEAAMRNLLEQYFELAGQARDEFVLKHPEIPAYFEDRRAEKSLEGDIYDAFDHTDPRLRQYFTQADDLLRAAEDMRRKLREQALKKFTPDSIESRRERRPGDGSL